jgi:phosphatidylserine/phosphatidylglycerophosphate/cardiolipin synthase-like enzyme
LETALIKAANRGVFVHALIASTNRGGEKSLRELEARLLAAGVTVGRTASDLVRYHGKFMIIDRRDLYLLAFNFTYADIERSRSFAVVTSNPEIVQEAAKLFDADAKRQTYESENGSLVVSPFNARKQLSAFIKGARKQLLIYDPKISDPAMIRLLEERAKAGVEIHVIGRMTRRSQRIPVRKLSQNRLHTRTILRDGNSAFVGSQSLRTLELDQRREVGLIFRDARICKRLAETFAQDWDASGEALHKVETLTPATMVAKKVAKVVTKELPAVVPMVEIAMKEMAGPISQVDIDPREIESAVKDAVKQAVKDVVRDAVQDAVEPADADMPVNERVAS